MCYPTILTNTLVPQPRLLSILQNQLGVALDALTLSCKLHALLSAAPILIACLLELYCDCLTCAKVAKICQELKLGKG